MRAWRLSSLTHVTHCNLYSRQRSSSRSTTALGVIVTRRFETDLWFVLYATRIEDSIWRAKSALLAKMHAMTSGSLRVRVWLLCTAALVGVYLCSSGLLRLNEVFTQSASTISPSHSTNSGRKIESASDGARRAAPAKQYDRLVVVLIDALRADMVLGSDVMYSREPTAAVVSEGREATMPPRNDELNAHMLYTRGLVTSGDALGYIGHASVPTGRY